LCEYHQAQGNATVSNATTDSIPLPATAPADVLTDILREGARRLLADAIEAEVDAWLAHRADIRDDQGLRLVARSSSQSATATASPRTAGSR